MKLIKNIVDYYFNKKYMYEYLKRDHLNLQISYSELNTKQINKLNEKDDEIYQLTKKVANLQRDKEFLLNPPKVSKPYWLIGEMAYKPTRRYVSKNLDAHFGFKKPQYVFDKSTMLYDLMKENDLLKVEKTYDNMLKVHNLIIKHVTYEHDKLDNWRPTTDILLSKLDDCDGSGCLITSALGMAGWDETEVFTVAGHYKKFCHAWAVCKTNGVWYVLEGTNRYAKPRVWDKAQEYKADLGLVNWKFQGMISKKVNKGLYLYKE